MKNQERNQSPTTRTRQIAADVLTDVLHRNKELDAALAHHAERALVSPQDKAFTRRLVMTTLRHHGMIRKLLGELVPKPLTGKQRRVEVFLSLGIAQLYRMEVPDYAAVNTMVELVKQEGFENFAGLVNAVLKNAAKRKDAILRDPALGKINTPRWLWERWCKTYAEEMTTQIARAHLQEPPLDLSFVSESVGNSSRSLKRC